MPNGGWDCCGECPHLVRDGVEKERGKNGAAAIDDQSSEDGQCAIRRIRIDSPYLTYCANHPVHNRARVRRPVGRVFFDAGNHRRGILYGPPQARRSHRRLLCGLIRRIDRDGRGANKNHFITDFDVEVVTHLGHLGEPCALPSLAKIAQWDVGKRSEEPPDDPLELIVFVKDAILVGAAHAALVRIAPDLWIDELSATMKDYGRPGQLGFRLNGIVRYQALRAMVHIYHPGLYDTIESMKRDPVDQVRAYAHHVHHQLKSDLYDDSLDIAEGMARPSAWGALNLEQLEGADGDE